MKPRFLADADLHGPILKGVRQREPAVDFMTAREAWLQGVPDPDVLALALRERRILVSHDFKTMPRHFWEFALTHESPGVFLISQEEPIGAAIEALVEIWLLSEAEEWANRLTYVPLR